MFSPDTAARWTSEMASLAWVSDMLCNAPRLVSCCAFPLGRTNHLAWYQGGEPSLLRKVLTPMMGYSPVCLSIS